MNLRKNDPNHPSKVSGQPEKSSQLPSKRPKKARRSVLIADRLADKIITIGGMLVIIAVFGILVFLVRETLPLFSGGSIVAQSQYDMSVSTGPAPVLNIDEYHTIAVAIAADGSLTAFHATTGKVLQAPSFDFKGEAVTSMGHTIDLENLIFGFSDGCVRFGKTTFNTEILPLDQLPAQLQKLDDRDMTNGTAVYSFIPGNQIRKISIETSLEDKVKISETGSAIIAVDYRIGGTAERPVRAFVAMDDKGQAYLSLARLKQNLLTGKMTTNIEKAVLPPIPEAKVSFLMLTGTADQVYAADRQGKVYRYNTQKFDEPELAEVVQVLPEGVELTAFGFLLGEQSIMVGGSDGSVALYFRLARPGCLARDGCTLVKARQLRPHSASVQGFVPGLRGKTFITADASGEVWMRHGTSRKTLLRLTGGQGALRALALSPRSEGVVAIYENGRSVLWKVSVPHPETSFSTLFGKVWYEGYPEPTYTWQSSAATDEFEPKLSLIPLIFGTLKATVYSLLFAIPIALLGAIYTSEFLHLRTRAVVKPTMEMMASLPSVVLGFVAALVLAPVVETWIGAVILAFLVLPSCFIGAAYLWQFLPAHLAFRLQFLPKSILIISTAALGLWLAWALGPSFENLFFDGDFRTWLNGRQDAAAPFLFLLLLPVSFLMVSMLGSRLYGRRLKMALRQVSQIRAAALSMLHWLAMAAAAATVAAGLAFLLSKLGMDARGGFLNTYVQRNTLVVGFTMGFAVIPIIYTLAEDALSAVPEHLRAASLGCGATTWQTALWVVLPTAVSGIFSAVMIGMGRAVGETMIVVMATGNTPIIDWNIFNGLRALSANIAVELPEAVKDGTLYRVLFLAGLVLFAMTFVINTLAEIIRQRFRKRATQL